MLDCANKPKMCILIVCKELGVLLLDILGSARIPGHLGYLRVPVAILFQDSGDQPHYLRYFMVSIAHLFQDVPADSLTT